MPLSSIPRPQSYTPHGHHAYPWSISRKPACVTLPTHSNRPILPAPCARPHSHGSPTSLPQQPYYVQILLFVVCQGCLQPLRLAKAGVPASNAASDPLHQTRGSARRPRVDGTAGGQPVKRAGGLKIRVGVVVWVSMMVQCCQLHQRRHTHAARASCCRSCPRSHAGMPAHVTSARAACLAQAPRCSSCCPGAARGAPGAQAWASRGPGAGAAPRNRNS